MKVLILTNPDHIDFVASYVVEKLRVGDDASFKYTGEYDWMGEDYDVGISFMYQYKVPAKEVNAHTWFNFHPAPLPEYKGRNLCYHAIMNGEKEFGTTVHYMDEGFDTGDIIDCFKFQIFPDDTAESLSEFAVRQSKAQFQAYLPDILAGKEFERIPNVGGTYYPKDIINDIIPIGEIVDRKIRAIMYKDFYPKLVSPSGQSYKIVQDD